MLLKCGIIVIGAIFMVAGISIDCYPEDSPEANEMIIAEGNVTNIDWVASVFTVGDVEFSVPSNIEVKKGEERMSFSDIDIGDSVKVVYSREKDGTLKAHKIIIAYSGEMAV